MNHYESKVYYMKKDLAVDDNRMEHGSGVAATATVEIRYLRVVIKIYPHMINMWEGKKMSDEEVHEIIAHEVSHLATNHLFQMATATYRDEGEMKDAWEGLTTIVGRLVHEVDKRRRGFKSTKDKQYA